MNELKDLEWEQRFLLTAAHSYNSEDEPMKPEDVIIAGYKDKESTFTMPELSPWKCYLFRDDKGYGMTYRPQKGAEPNWFWRMTQHLILGHKWVKDEP